MVRAKRPLRLPVVPYRELGPDYYDRRHAQRVTRRAVELLGRQGLSCRSRTSCMSASLGMTVIF